MTRLNQQINHVLLVLSALHQKHIAVMDLTTERLLRGDPSEIIADVGQAISMWNSLQANR